MVPLDALYVPYLLTCTCVNFTPHASPAPRLRLLPGGGPAGGAAADLPRADARVSVQICDAPLVSQTRAIEEVDSDWVWLHFPCKRYNVPPSRAYLRPLPLVFPLRPQLGTTNPSYYPHPALYHQHQPPSLRSQHLHNGTGPKTPGCAEEGALDCNPQLAPPSGPMPGRDAPPGSSPPAPPDPSPADHRFRERGNGRFRG